MCAGTESRGADHAWSSGGSVSSHARAAHPDRPACSDRRGTAQVGRKWHQASPSAEKLADRREEKQRKKLMHKCNLVQCPCNFIRYGYGRYASGVIEFIAHRAHACAHRRHVRQEIECIHATTHTALSICEIYAVMPASAYFTSTMGPRHAVTPVCEVGLVSALSLVSLTSHA